MGVFAIKIGDLFENVGFQGCIVVEFDIQSRFHGLDDQPSFFAGKYDAFGGGANAIGFPISNGLEDKIEGQHQFVGFTEEEFAHVDIGTGMGLVGSFKIPLAAGASPHGGWSILGNYKW